MDPSGLHVTAATLPKSWLVIVSLIVEGLNCKPFSSSFAPGVPCAVGPQRVSVEGSGTSCAQVSAGAGGVVPGVSQTVYVVEVENGTLNLYEPSCPVGIEAGCAPPYSVTVQPESAEPSSFARFWFTSL